MIVASSRTYAINEQVLRWSQKYIDWCVRHGFLSAICTAQDLLAPDSFENPVISPFFIPEYYLGQTGFNSTQQVNAYLHYFTQGWRAGSCFSRIVDVLAMRESGFIPSGKLPLLIEVIEQLEKNDNFSPHILFEAAIYRKFSSRNSVPAFVEFIREPISFPFSRYVDLDLLNHELYCWNIRAKNALLCYLESAPGTDINPFLFSIWYNMEYERIPEHIHSHRDLLSDYILLGSKSGFFPNPFLRELFGSSKKAHIFNPVYTLRDAVLIPKYNRLNATQ